MKVFSRSDWTTSVCRSNPSADVYDRLPYYRENEVKGIDIISPSLEVEFGYFNPVENFRELLHEAFSRGRSDIEFNLGCSTNTVGVWNLRGLHNKNTSSPDSNHNGAYLSVYLSLGKTEKPTDQILRNLLDARRLVLSRYPGATQIIDSSKNPYIKAIVPKKVFWEEKLIRSIDSSDFIEEVLPPPPLKLGMQNVYVQQLQDLLAYFGYYKVRVDGVFNEQTRDAIVRLKADLQDASYYSYGLDDEYTDHLKRAWVKYLDTI